MQRAKLDVWLFDTPCSNGKRKILKVKLASLTCTFSPGDERRPRRPCSSLPGSGQQDFNLILHIWIQVPKFIGGGIYHVGLCPVPWRGAVLHLLQDDWPIPDDAVGVGFDPKVGGANSEELGRSDGRGWSCEIGKEMIKISFFFPFLI